MLNYYVDIVFKHESSHNVQSKQHACYLNVIISRIKNPFFPGALLKPREKQTYCITS